MSVQNEIDFNDFISKSRELVDSLCEDKIISKKFETEKSLENPDIWHNQLEATRLNKELSATNSKLSKIQKFKNDLENLQIAIDLQEYGEVHKIHFALNKQYLSLQQETFLNGKFDFQGALISIHAGAGGVDAQDWAAMLLSMYQAFVRRQGWQSEIVYLSSGDEGGVKSAFMTISGENVYGLIKEEAGVHRLVRISPFNAGKTRETSFALVEVLPDDLESEIHLGEIPEKDLRWEYFMSSGKGGQSVNTTYSAVRVIHIPTNISVTCQNQRSQLQNKQEALKYLRNKLVAVELKKHKDLQNEIKGDFQSAQWGSQIRSYVLHPYKMVKDHRSGFETDQVNSVIEDGDILSFIWAMKTK